MNQTDDLYARIKKAEKDIEELNKAIIKFKKDFEEEIYNITSSIEIAKENQ